MAWCIDIPHTWFLWGLPRSRIARTIQFSHTACLGRKKLCLLFPMPNMCWFQVHGTAFWATTDPAPQTLRNSFWQILMLLWTLHVQQG